MRTAVLSLFLLSLSACSPGYVIRAAYEEGKILWRREPIKELLKNPELNNDTREKFELVLAVRDYARDKLRLRVKGSYASYSHLDRPVVSYVLTVAPQTSLEPYTWWFPFVGRVPYKGYFSQAEADSKAVAFQKRSYDTSVRPVSAFSTLGWFDDPLLDHLLKLDKVTLTEVIFHELMHNTLFVAGSMRFNESLANFFGNRAGMSFFRDRYGEKSAVYLQARTAWEQELEFAKFINRVADRLEELYQMDLTQEEILARKEKTFSQSQKDWSQRISGNTKHRYSAYSEQEVNNAVMVHYLLYLGGLEMFESVYQAQGGDLVRFRKAIQQSVEDGEPPFEAVRQLLPDGAPQDGSRPRRGASLYRAFASKDNTTTRRTPPGPSESGVPPSTNP